MDDLLLTRYYSMLFRGLLVSIPQQVRGVLARELIFIH